MTKKTKIVKCPSCRGRKMTMGMGFNMKDCRECKAVGYIEELIDEIAYLEEKSNLPEENNAEVIENIFDDAEPKKRGRKKKVA